jgi:hypothetical protein
VAKFTFLTPLSLPILCTLSFPTVGLEILSLPTVALISPKKNVRVVLQELIEHTF